MKSMTNLIFSCVISLTLSNAHGTLNAMEKFRSSPLKRSRVENGAQVVPSKVDYIAALDAALLTVDDDGTTVLHAAAGDGNLVMCRDLLARGASPLWQNKLGLSPMHCAVAGNHYEVVQQLLDGIPNGAKCERVVATLCILRRYHIPLDLRLTVLSYLPDLIAAYPGLCKRLVPNYITEEQLRSAHYASQVKLLKLQDKEGRSAYSIAKNNRNGFMARMTNPSNRMAACKEKITHLLEDTTPADSKENKESSL